MIPTILAFSWLPSPGSHRYTHLCSITVIPAWIAGAVRPRKRIQAARIAEATVHGTGCPRPAGMTTLVYNDESPGLVTLLLKAPAFGSLTKGTEIGFAMAMAIF